MPLPQTKRVLYDKNPLKEVICQLRFPVILRIGVEDPASFQEKIRESFPIFSEKTIPPLLQNHQLPKPLAELVGEFSGLPGLHRGREFKFKSEDAVWETTLTREFLALTTTRYIRWEEFRSKLEISLAALLEEYSPSFFSRIGLRYRNLICPEELGLNSQSWSALLRKEIVGVLDTDLGNDLEQTAHDIVIRLGSGGRARIQHGLQVESDRDKDCYVIDADYYSEERTEEKNVLQRLDSFNGISGSFFRWCIDESLHNALGPNAITTW